MPKRIAYDVRLRQASTGLEHDRLIFAQDEATARERGCEGAAAIGKPFVERQYGQFEVLSCQPRS